MGKLDFISRVVVLIMLISPLSFQFASASAFVSVCIWFECASAFISHVSLLIAMVLVHLVSYFFCM